MATREDTNWLLAGGSGFFPVTSDFVTEVASSEHILWFSRFDEFFL